MSFIDDPIIISEENRKLEIKKIEKFLDSIPDIKNYLLKKTGSIYSYINYYHFMASNNLISHEYWIHGELLPIGYYDSGTAIIYIPTVETTENYNYIHENNNIYRCNKIINRLKKFGTRKWIFDIRGNLGGEMLTFLSYIIRFIPKKLTIDLYKSGSNNMKIEIDGDKIFWGNEYETILNGYFYTSDKIEYDEIQVLLNEYSYSGAEFLSYILKKYCNAKLIGLNKSGGALTTVNEIKTSIGEVWVPYCKILDGKKQIKKYICPESNKLPKYI